nr:MAG TPA_asm: hypothetical protein [Caudoviricetes sp.]DAV35410.1 MAG TPA: hypothetical protein [Bacteriophage sp.]
MYNTTYSIVATFVTPLLSDTRYICTTLRGKMWRISRLSTQIPLSGA